MKFRMVVVVLVIAVFGAAGCRSRVKPATAPMPPEAAPAQEVPAPVGDFAGVPEPDESIDMSDIDELNRRAQEEGWVRDAFFEYDQFALSANAREALSVSAGWLRKNPGVGLTVEGHCDERGTSQYNLALGERRAWSARQYLESLGIDSSRLRTMSFGEERPFAEGLNEAAWAKNRRAHLVLYKID